MRTETRIGVVTGLTVVVAASVYFWRTRAEERDLIVALTAKPAAGEAQPTIAIPKPVDAPAAASAAPGPTIAAGDPAPLAGSIIDPLAPLVPLRTGASEFLREAATPALPTNEFAARPEPAWSEPAPAVVAGPPSLIAPLAPPPASATPPSLASDTAPPPAEASAETPAPAPAGDWPRYHVVARGDTLTSIARATYHDARRTDLIVAANPELKDPHHLRVGVKLTLPSPLPGAAPTATSQRPATLIARSAAPATVPPEASQPDGPAAGGESHAPDYVVRPGDSFYSIAESKLGSGGRWKELLEINTKLVGGDPRKLRPGMTLTLPEKK